MKTIIIEIPEDEACKIKKMLRKFKDITFYEEENDGELIQSKNEIIAYNRALQEFKNGEALSIGEYLKSRNIHA
jgi:ribosome maturation protein Sdo1